MSDSRTVSPPGRVQAAGTGIQGGEQPVLHQDTGVGQLVEERRLSGIGVAHQRHGGQPAAPAGFPLQASLFGEASQIALETGHAANDAAPIHLQLRLSWAPGPDATSLLGQLPSPTAQAGQPVPQLGQLHLGFAFLGVGVLGEDVEDHRGAIDGCATQDLLQVSRLGGGELVVEHDGVGIDGGGQVPQLPSLAPSHVGGRVGVVATLDDPSGLVGAGRVDEQGQLIEMALGLIGALGGNRDPDQHDLLPEGALDQAHGRTTQMAMCTLGPASVAVPSGCRATTASPPGWWTVTARPTRPQ